MACSVRLSSSIVSHNLAFKNKYIPNILCNRFFCSKDKDGKAESSSADKSTSNEKLEENTKEVAEKSKTSRFKATPVSNEVKEAAKQKLMSLLSEITITSDKPDTKLNIARAVKRISKKERLRQMEAAKITPEKKINMAVKAIASNFKEDAEKVESELTKKLSTLNLTTDAPDEVEVAEDAPLIDDKLSANLMSSVEEVADTISENPIPPRSELTKRLLSLDQKYESQQKPVRSVLESMVIESKQPVSTPPAIESKQIIPGERRKEVKQFQVSRKLEKVNLFGAPPLNIFEPGAESKPDSSNTFWQRLQEKELILLTQFAPANAFEEMIMWTEQGKHWKFPIDNETEMGAEEKVGFHEHVFLEHHLKGFPTKGPIRHFMELVCVGLSKNPYITVERKIENIDWFRNYFNEKEEILRDAGAID